MFWSFAAIISTIYVVFFRIIQPIKCKINGNFIIFAVASCGILKQLLLQ